MARKATRTRVGKIMDQEANPYNEWSHLYTRSGTPTQFYTYTLTQPHTKVAHSMFSQEKVSNGERSDEMSLLLLGRLLLPVYSSQI